MLAFQPLQPEHVSLVYPYLQKSKSRLCDCSIGAIFQWRQYYKTCVAVEDDVLYFRVCPPEEERCVFTPPLGGDGKTPYETLKAFCDSKNIPMHLGVMSQADLADLQQVFPKLGISENRDWSDYLYDAEAIKTLPGKPYHGQRNHISRFRRTYPDWAFLPLNGETLPMASGFLKKYYHTYWKAAPTFAEEARTVQEMLENFVHYHQVGGVLTVEGQVVGISMGEVVKDTLFVHTEKADREYQGAYAMLVNQFANHFATEGVQYINREEDVGDEGLRKSKLSYHPVELLKKYSITVLDE